MILENGTNKCNCVKTTCDRHGKCEECKKHHEKRKHSPSCTRHKPKIIK